MNIANYNTLVALFDLWLRLQITRYYNSLDLLHFILFTVNCVND